MHSSRTAPTWILLVDEEVGARNSAASTLHQYGYVCVPLSNRSDALDFLRNSPAPLIIARLPADCRDSHSWVKQVRAQHLDSAVLVIGIGNDPQGSISYLRAGASEYLPSDITQAGFLAAVERALARREFEAVRHERQRTLERREELHLGELASAHQSIRDSYENTLLALVSALDAREQETCNHSRRVVEYSLAIARQVGLDGQELEDVRRGSLLHDIGKIGVPDAVLLKPGPLNASEWEAMRLHPEIGHEMIAQLPFLSVTADIVLTHHERFDGRGYPNGLIGLEIPLGARIFAIADAFDAMTSNRPYRRGIPFPAAREQIAHCSGSQFDPEIVRAFLSVDLQHIYAIREQFAYSRSGNSSPRIMLTMSAVTQLSSGG